MYCYNCGKELKDGSRFCPNCGTRLEIPGRADTDSQDKKQAPFEPEPAVKRTQPNSRQNEQAQNEQAQKKQPQKEQPVYAGPEEPARFDGEVHFSLHSYLLYTAKLTITKRDLKTVIPKKPVLGIIPTGSTSQMIPLRNIGNVVVNRTFNIKAILLGLLIMFFGFSAARSSDAGGFGIFLILLGIGAILLEGIDSSLRIDYGSATLLINAWFFEIGKLNRIRDILLKALYYESDKNDMNLQRESLAKAIGREFRDVMKD